MQLKKSSWPPSPLVWSPSFLLFLLSLPMTEDTAAMAAMKSSSVARMAAHTHGWNCVVKMSLASFGWGNRMLNGLKEEKMTAR